jgi:phospholipid/cholesterol/gamma-HCH transport system substrate-binding protein
MMRPEVKVGLFALISILIIIYATVKVSEQGMLATGSYRVYVILESAQGLNPKTPVEIAGIQVGTLSGLELTKESRARIALNIEDDVKLTKDVIAQVRSKGFLGETFIDLKQGNPQMGFLAEDDTITAVNPYTDFTQLGERMGEIANDVKEITSSVKTIFGSGEDAPMHNIAKNLEAFTNDLKNFSSHNRDDLNQVVSNLAQLTEQLSILVSENRDDVTNSMAHIESVARKIDEGQGTLGRLVNDETTIEELNSAVANLNDTLGGFKAFQLGMGYQVEYLGKSESFKNYVNLNLRPRPDTAFIFDFVSDSDPAPKRETVIADIITGGNTTSVTTNRQIIKRDEFLFSAQMAQDVHDFTLRGGIIESSAGIGLDWTKHFFKASISAFDFSSEDNRKPHLKAWATLNLTDNFFLVGGVDDPLNPLIETDWFAGAGFQFVTDDIKNLIGLGASATK